MFNVWRWKNETEKEILQTYDTYDEALEYVLKIGDRSILAKINGMDEE